MLWLLIIILAYLFFSIASLGDKLILVGPPKPKSYVFYVGILGISVVLLIPFIEFSFPSLTALFWIILEAIVFTAGLYLMFSALEKFEVSKVMVTIGAIQPILILILTWIFWGGQIIGKINILAFIILLVGSIIISIEKNINLMGNYFKITFFSALMFSLDYIFSKFIFLNQPFLQGFIWTRMFIFIIVLSFLLSKEFRKEVFKKRIFLNKKTGILLFFTQVSGGTANMLQSFSIFLVPIAFLPILNALRGIQYVLLFFMTLFISYFYPKVLKEKISKGFIAQKIISTALIVLGLAILAIY